MILLLYNLALLAALVVSVPWWLFRMATTHKYREGLKERLGWTRPPANPANLPILWIHAVSVGEVLAVSRLVQTLDAALLGHSIVISTTTRTGQALARERFGAGRIFYCPLDLPWATRAWLNRLRPEMLILAETEFWPNLLSGCFRRNIPVVIVNARVSDRSWPRYRRLRRPWRPILSRLTAVLAQSAEDAERLRSLGCPSVTVSGNLKFDVQSSAETPAVILIRNLAGALRLFVAGSTLEGEEAILLEHWPRILQADSHQAMILAPRHPERIPAVIELLEQSGHPWRKRSSLQSQPICPSEIVILDSMGELASLYSLATVAFVGGSLVPVGGHNPLEPAQFGIPILMGPSYANFRAIVDSLLAKQAIQIVETQGKSITQAVTQLLSHPQDAASMGERARIVFREQAGATSRTATAILKILADRAAS